MEPEGELMIDPEWEELDEPGLGEKILSWAVAFLAIGAAIYFGAHLLVAMGVGCGG
jgi:hypothetical protein